MGEILKTNFGLRTGGMLRANFRNVLKKIVKY